MQTERFVVAMTILDGAFTLMSFSQVQVKAAPRTQSCRVLTAMSLGAPVKLVPVSPPPQWGGIMFPMNQQSFLKRAKLELGLPYRVLAAELGVSERTIEKWSLKAASEDHREMPLMAIRLLLRMLDDRKREHLARGDRSAAEVIDALGVQVDAARLSSSMKTFDALQRSAVRLAPLRAPRRKPSYFATLSEKNAWERNEETRRARFAHAKASAKR